jgi:hypothetical protein
MQVFLFIRSMRLRLKARGKQSPASGRHPQAYTGPITPSLEKEVERKAKNRHPAWL